MSQIFGLLGLPDTDRSFVNTVGQRVVYDAIMEILNRHNQELDAAIGIFSDGTTEDFKFRYKLPGGGYLQRRGGQAQSANVKRVGQWDVALPLEDFGAAVGGDRVSLAYMTMKELDTHIDTITLQDINTVRLEILKALFDSAQYTFVDPIHGSLTITPLANNDAVVYPPVIGSETEAADNHYLESGYIATAISDSNNPYVTMRDELEEHFGYPQGGSNLIAFINKAETAETEALTDFTEVQDRFVRPGDNTAVLEGLPSTIPGRIIGRTNGVWVAEWGFIPAGYMLGVHLDAPKPLMQRVDPANTGLPRGLSLISESDEYPLQNSHYAHRFGFAVVNRLNGVVMELANGGSYTVPTGFGH
jgi:hypothetical protein